MNIVLCGLPMSGKTAIGKKLAKLLSWEVIDVDDLIEKKEGISCREIYRKKGALFFRQKEKEALLSLKESKKSVISTGGGSISFKENRELLSSLGKVIYLKAPFDLIWKRLSQRDLPAYLSKENPKEDFFQLVNERIDLYKQMADYTVDTEDLQEDGVALKIVQEIGLGK